MKEETITFNDLLKRYNRQLDDSITKSNDVIVIPNTRLSADDIQIIKRIRNNDKKVHIPDSEKIKYKEFRGGEFELALMVINQTVVPLVIGIVSAWIYDKIKGYSTLKKDTKNDDLKRPPFKLEFYFTKNEKYVNLEGEADDILKALDKIKKDYDPT